MLGLKKKFNSSQLNWTVSQKELWPALKPFQQVTFRLECHLGSIHLFTDHEHLFSISKPEWSEKAFYFCGLRRWSLMFQHLSIRVHHIPYYQNSFADIFTSWAMMNAIFLIFYYIIDFSFFMSLV